MIVKCQTNILQENLENGCFLHHTLKATHDLDPNSRAFVGLTPQPSPHPAVYTITPKTQPMLLSSGCTYSYTRNPLPSGFGDYLRGFPVTAGSLRSLTLPRQPCMLTHSPTKMSKIVIFRYLASGDLGGRICKFVKKFGTIFTNEKHHYRGPKSGSYAQ